MPPQQAYGLPDFVDEVLDFVTHFGPGESCLAPAVERRGP
jgi:hypothetical protein